MFENFTTRVGDFLNSDMLPVALGMGAQGFMAGHPNTWQAGLGRAGVALGQSNIAAKAARRQAEERRSVNQLIADLLAGKGLTAPGYDGPSSINTKTTPEDQTITVKGNNILPKGERGFEAAQGRFGGQQNMEKGGLRYSPRTGIFSKDISH